MIAEKETIDTEGAVLGSCLASKEAINYAFYHLPEEYFLEAKNKALFGVYKRLFKSGVDIDPITVLGSMSDYEKKKIGGEKYVLGLAEAVPTALNIRHYVSLVRKKYVLVNLAERYDKAKANPLDIENQKEIRKLWDEVNGDDNAVVDAREATLRYTDTLAARKSGKFDRILSGFDQMDAIVGGFYRGNMVILGARTSVGKTSFLLNMAMNFVRRKVKVLFVSAEMTWDELLDRIVSAESGVFVSKLRRGDLQQDDYAKVGIHLAEIADMPLYCIDGGRMSIARIRLAVEIVKPDAIYVDFIQRFTPPNPNQNRAAFFSDLANDLKALAMEKKIVVVAASQMNREIERQERRDPQLSDLKESGGIEEAADVAILMQAEKQEDVMSPERNVTFHIKKNRHGPTGQVEFTFQKTKTNFVEKFPEPQFEERPVAGND